MSQSSYPLSRGGDIIFLRCQSEATFPYDEKTVWNKFQHKSRIEWMKPGLKKDKPKKYLK